jgi:hypothetical protein
MPSCCFAACVSGEMRFATNARTVGKRRPRADTCGEGRYRLDIRRQRTDDIDAVHAEDFAQLLETHVRRGLGRPIHEERTRERVDCIVHVGRVEIGQLLHLKGVAIDKQKAETAVVESEQIDAPSPANDLADFPGLARYRAILN